MVLEELCALFLDFVMQFHAIEQIDAYHLSSRQEAAVLPLVLKNVPIFAAIYCVALYRKPFESLRIARGCAAFSQYFRCTFLLYESACYGNFSFWKPYWDLVILSYLLKNFTILVLITNSNNSEIIGSIDIGLQF